MDARSQIIEAFRKFSTYSGRAGRSEYWTFAGFGLVCVVLAFLLGPLFAFVAAILCAVPGVALLVRRLHDVGRSGWWAILPVVVVPAWLLVWALSAAAALAVRVDTLDNPIYFMTASAIMLAVVTAFVGLLVQPSQPGDNFFGPNPNEVSQ